MLEPGKVRFQDVRSGKWFRVDANGSIVASADVPDFSVVFQIEAEKENQVYLQAYDGKRIKVDSSGRLVPYSGLDDLETSKARKLASSNQIRAVNLGGWLVIEGWMKPSLFDGIPDSDLLDGAQIQLKSVTLGTYVSADGGGGQNMVVNRASASGWETFKVWRINDGTYSLRVFGNQFVSAQNAGGGAVTATGATPREWERLTITRGPNQRVHIRVYNGMYMQATNQNQLTADYSGSEPGWDNNAATFVMTVLNSVSFHGDFQLANGWGPAKAPAVFKQHRDTFVTASDFQTLRGLGINAVRIPVGWWIASDPNPPAPFVAGSLQALDNAFKWAGQYGMKIIIDLHAAPGSQNGQEHSATRDGSSEWATGTDNIAKTVHVIDFLAARYASNSALFAIELLNEPVQQFVPVDTLKSFYKQGYAAVRKHSSSVYVMMCQLLGTDPHNLLDLGTGFNNAILDLHYYNLYTTYFENLSVQGNIDYILNNRKQELQSLNQNSNGLLTFVGEWVNEWDVKGASQQDYQRFGQAQLQVYGGFATSGWSYWNFKMASDIVHWDFERTVQQKYLLQPSGGW